MGSLHLTPAMTGAPEWLRIVARFAELVKVRVKWKPGGAGRCGGGVEEGKEEVVEVEAEGVERWVEGEERLDA